MSLKINVAAPRKSLELILNFFLTHIETLNARREVQKLKAASAKSRVKSHHKRNSNSNAGSDDSWGGSVANAPFSKDGNTVVAKWGYEPVAAKGAIRRCIPNKPFSGGTHRPARAACPSGSHEEVRCPWLPLKLCVLGEEVMTSGKPATCITSEITRWRRDRPILVKKVTPKLGT